MGAGRRVPVGPLRNMSGVPNPEDALYINLSVKDLNGKEVFLRMKRQLRKLMIAYCDRLARWELNWMRFVYAGRHISPDQTRSR